MDDDFMTKLEGQLERLGRCKPSTRRNDPFYKLLKSRLQPLGYWKELPRGDPKKGAQIASERAKQRGDRAVAA